MGDDNDGYDVINEDNDIGYEVKMMKMIMILILQTSDR